MAVDQTRKEKHEYIRQQCEADLWTFAQVIEPRRCYGEVHEQLFKWWQYEAGDNSLCLLPRDHQKALRLDQKVLTPEGWVKTGDLEVGSTVFSNNGLPQKVTHLHPISEMDIYEVEFCDGRKVKCNDEHLWTVVCPSNTGSKQVTKPLKDIMKNYKSDRFDKRNGETYTEWRYFLDQCLPIEFEEKQLPIDPYTLGVWLGDGDSSTGLVTSYDQQIIDSIIYQTKPLKSDSNRFRVEGLTPLLRKNDLLNNKHIPEIYFRASVLQRLELLQGLMDTDGHAHITNKNSSFTTTLPAIRDGVVDLVRSLGGKAKVHDQWTKISKESEKLHHSYCINIWMQDGINPFKLTRKAERVQLGQRTRVAIKNITKIEPALARCITVENENGLFITEDYIVTHNSHCMAVLAAWMITRDPACTILYISATSYLAQQQLRDIKNILTSKIYKSFWPEMINPEEGQREKWTNTEICVDHPKRSEEGVRDSTIFTAGLTTNTTGLHCNIILKDDIVVPDNAYTEEGRRSVDAACSQLASILTTGGREVCVGTRYHPKDHYDVLKEMTEEVFDDDGEIVGRAKVYKIFEKQVETNGVFLWPKQYRADDGKPFGFNNQELARKKAKYTDTTQFYAQYYNNPNDMENARLDRSKFQYYKREFIVQKNGIWHYQGNRLNVYAAIDFAYSMSVKADYSCIVVIGIDSKGDIYVLDIARFKTNKMETYFQNILDLHTKWEFMKIRAEVSVAQEAIVQYIQDRAKDLGMSLKVDRFRPTRNLGSKEERIKAILEPRYENQEVWHYKGGYISMLEEELLQANPKHDDLKDCLASVVSMETVRPRSRRDNEGDNVLHLSTHKRFGGITY